MFKLLLQHLGLIKPSIAKFEVTDPDGDVYTVKVHYVGPFDYCMVHRYVQESTEESLHFIPSNIQFLGCDNG